MENKKLEKKSVLKKLTIGIAAMALISCAFVGGTFARYTTGEKEIPGGVNVADWKIEVIEDAADIFEFTPNMDAPAADQIRTKTVSKGGKILEIKNSGKVAATVTIKVDTSSYVMEDKEGNPAKFPEYDVVDGEAVNAAWQNVSVDDIFTINDLTVQYSGSTSAETGVKQGTVTTYTITLHAGESVIVSIGEVVWTSDFNGTDGLDDGVNIGTYGDLRDTWIGENISQIGYKMTWSAVQAEEIPVN